MSVFFISNSYQKWELTITKKHQPYILKHLFENKLVSMVYVNVCNFLFTTKIINIQIFVHNAWSSLFQIEADTPIVKLGRPKEILVSPLKIGPVRKIMFDSHIPVKVLSTNIQRYDLKPSNKYKCESSQYLDLHVCQCVSKKNNDKQMVCKRAGILNVHNKSNCVYGAFKIYHASCQLIALSSWRNMI